MKFEELGIETTNPAEDDRLGSDGMKEPAWDDADGWRKFIDASIEKVPNF